MAHLFSAPVRLIAALLIGFTVTAARAELAITIDKGNFQPMPIAITDFVGADAAMNAQISAVIINNLKRSGVFQPIDKAAFIDKNPNFDAVPNFAHGKRLTRKRW